MKKRMIVLLAALCTVSLIGGCGDKKAAKNETEVSDGETSAEAYNVDDCVKLGEYKGLELTLGTYEVTEEDVRNNIESTLASYPS